MSETQLKKVSFPNTGINVKTLSKLKQTQYSKILLVHDALNSNLLYILKILRASTADKQELNAINNEVVLLVTFFLFQTHLKGNPNVVQLVDFFFQNSVKETFLYLLIEFCPGNTEVNQVGTSPNRL